MKGKGNILFSMVLGIMIGWALGFLRLPYIERNDSFWVGMLAGIGVMALLLFFLFVWNKNKWNRLIGKGETGTTTSSFWMLCSAFILLGGLLGGFFIFKQNKSLKIQANDLNEKMEEQSASLQTIKNNNQVLLMNGFLQNVEDELKANEMGSLSEGTITKIVDLTHSFAPDVQIAADSLSIIKTSFERGQLLIGLLKLNLDSIAFNKIKQSASFAGAALKKVDFSGMDLSGIDLEYANLWGANLQRANLQNANLNQANMEWVDLNEANLQKANLDGAKLLNSKLIKAKLKEATLQWVDLDGVFLDEADFSNSNMFGVNIMNTHLNNTNFTDANLKKINITEHWLEEVTASQVIGIDSIKANYKRVPDPRRKDKKYKFRLEDINW